MNIIGVLAHLVLLRNGLYPFCSFPLNLCFFQLWFYSFIIFGHYLPVLLVMLLNKSAYASLCGNPPAMLLYALSQKVRLCRNNCEHDGYEPS